MKTLNTRKDKLKRGFSMLEIIITITIIGFIAAMASVKMGNTIGSSRQKAKESNARVMTTLIDEVKSLGGVVSADASADVDISSVEAIINSFSKEPALEIEGISFQVSPKPNPQSYKLETAGSNVQVVALNNTQAP